MFRLIIVAVALLYPFAVYFGLKHVSADILVGLLAVFVLSRILASDLGSRWKLLALASVVAAFVCHWWMRDGVSSLKFYPVLLNAALLVVFGLSLFRQQPLIETIARKRGMNVGTHNIRYLRVLTIVWTVFFAISLIASSLTAIHGDMDIWLLYNGFGSYLLMGTLVIGELIFRHFYRQRLNAA